MFLLIRCRRPRDAPRRRPRRRRPVRKARAARWRAIERCPGTGPHLSCDLAPGARTLAAPSLETATLPLAFVRFARGCVRCPIFLSSRRFFRRGRGRGGLERQLAHIRPVGPWQCVWCMQESRLHPLEKAELPRAYHHHAWRNADEKRARRRGICKRRRASSLASRAGNTARPKRSEKGARRVRACACARARARARSRPPLPVPAKCLSRGRRDSPGRRRHRRRAPPGSSAVALRPRPAAGAAGFSPQGCHGL